MKFQDVKAGRWLVTNQACPGAATEKQVHQIMKSQKGMGFGGAILPEDKGWDGLKIELIENLQKEKWEPQTPFQFLNHLQFSGEG